MPAYRQATSPSSRIHKGHGNQAGTGIRCTRHGESRMRQRGMKKGDDNLIWIHGTQIDDETFLLSNRDADREIGTLKREIETLKRRIRACKREIETLERLRNRKVVVRLLRVVTAYPSRPVDQKRALRKARQRGPAA